MRELRNFVGWLLIRAGMAALHSDTREMVRKIIMYHVPGGLSETEKADVMASKIAWLRELS